jgi:hypothetical protein
MSAASLLQKRRELSATVASGEAQKNRGSGSAGALRQQLIGEFACRPERQHTSKADGKLIGLGSQRQGPGGGGESIPRPEGVVTSSK